MAFGIFRTHAWLTGNWTGATLTEDPFARGSFGYHKRADELLFIREMY